MTIIKLTAEHMKVKQDWEELVSLTDLEIINEINETNEQLKQIESGED